MKSEFEIAIDKFIELIKKEQEVPKKTLIFSKRQYQYLQSAVPVTEEDLKNVQENGFIKHSNGVDWYLKKSINEYLK